MNIKKTANLLINFANNRLAELFGLILLSLGLLLFIALFLIHLMIQTLYFQKILKLKIF